MSEILSNIGEGINVVLLILAAIVGIVSVVYKIKSNFSLAITQFIKDAETEAELTGEEKMDLVVSWIKNLIPRIFTVVFSDTVLRNIADNIYNDMKAYREIYINNKTGLASSQVFQIVKKVTGDNERSIETEE